MPFRTEGDQDRRDTADEFMDLADRARLTRKAAADRGDRRVERLMGRLETALLHAACHLNPERIEVVPDQSYPCGKVLTVRYRSRKRQFHAPLTQWEPLNGMAG